METKIGTAIQKHPEDDFSPTIPRTSLRRPCDVPAKDNPGDIFVGVPIYVGDDQKLSRRKAQPKRINIHRPETLLMHMRPMPITI